MILDTADNRKFVLDGSDFTYTGSTVTGGTITSIHEFSADGTSAIADFTGVTIAAVAWLAAVQDAAAGNFGAQQCTGRELCRQPSSADPAPDSFGGAGNAETISGGGGNDVLDPHTATGGQHTLTGGTGADTFVYKQGYGAVTITDFDQGNSGTFDPREGDQIALDNLSNPVTSHAGQRQYGRRFRQRRCPDPAECHAGRGRGRQRSRPGAGEPR